MLVLFSCGSCLTNRSRGWKVFSEIETVCDGELSESWEFPVRHLKYDNFETANISISQCCYRTVSYSSKLLWRRSTFFDIVPSKYSHEGVTVWSSIASSPLYLRWVSNVHVQSKLELKSHFLFLWFCLSCKWTKGARKSDRYNLYFPDGVAESAQYNGENLDRGTPVTLRPRQWTSKIIGPIGSWPASRVMAEVVLCARAAHRSNRWQENILRFSPREFPPSQPTSMTSTLICHCASCYYYL